MGWITINQWLRCTTQRSQCRVKVSGLSYSSFSCRISTPGASNRRQSPPRSPPYLSRLIRDCSKMMTTQGLCMTQKITNPCMN
jgi:hypothetical protein